MQQVWIYFLSCRWSDEAHDSTWRESRWAATTLRHRVPLRSSGNPVPTLTEVSPLLELPGAPGATQDRGNFGCCHYWHIGKLQMLPTVQAWTIVSNRIWAMLVMDLMGKQHISQFILDPIPDIPKRLPHVAIHYHIIIIIMLVINKYLHHCLCLDCWQRPISGWRPALRSATAATFRDFLKGALCSHLHFQAPPSSQLNNGSYSEYFPGESLQWTFLRGCKHKHSLSYLLSLPIWPSLLLDAREFAWFA